MYCGLLESKNSVASCIPSHLFHCNVFHCGFAFIVTVKLTSAASFFPVSLSPCRRSPPLRVYGVIQDSLQVQFKASSTQAKAIFYPPFYLAAFLRFMRFLRRKSIGPFLSPTLEPGFKKVCFRPPKKPDLSGRSARQRLTCSLEILASSTTCHRQYFPL